MPAESRSPSRKKKKPTTGRRWYGTAIVIVPIVVVAAMLVTFLLSRGYREGPSLSGESPAPTRKTHEGRTPATLFPGGATGANLLLVTLDTTRADRLGCYGRAGAQTPTLDHLAAEGVRYSNAYATTPMTLPSHASVLTGLYPPAHGVRVNGEYRLDGHFTTLAEVLKTNGYQTAAFLSSFVLDARYGLSQGFDVYDFRVAKRASPGSGKYQERSAKAVTEAATQWLTTRASQRPFFLWVHYFDPHFPYQAPPEFSSRLPSQPYQAEIAYMDSQIARLMGALEVANLRSTTVIAVVGDHGESLGEHNERHHSRTIYDAAMKVPFIVSLPGIIPQNQVIDDTVVSLADVFPTTLDLLDLLTPELATSIDGDSLCERSDEEARIVFFETMATYINSGWAPLFGAARAGDKYIIAPKSEYYDLRTDPKELQNLIEHVTPDGVPKRALELKQFLNDYLADKNSPEEVASLATPPDPETQARLEALGYISESDPSRSCVDLPDPKDMLPLFHLYQDGKADLAQGRFQQAEERAKELLEFSPRDRAALKLLGEAYLRQGLNNKAEHAFRSRLEIRQDAIGSAFLANAVMLQNRFQEASDILDRAQESDPENGAIHFARGDLKLLQARPEEAISCYEKAASVDPIRFGRQVSIRLEQVRRLMAQR